MRSLVCGALVVCTACLAEALPGQIVVELGPRVGRYVSMSRIEGGVVTSGGVPDHPSDLTGIAWGGAVRVWLGARLGLAAQAAIVPTRQLGGSTPGGGKSPDTRAVIAPVSLDVLFPIVATQPLRVWAGAGVGVVRHGGSAYSSIGAPMRVAPSLELGGSLRLSDRLSTTADVLGMMYMYDIPDRTSTRSLQRGWVTALALTLGLDWAL